MNIRTYLLFSGTVFGAVCLLHALRLFNHWAVQIASVEIPLDASWLGLALAGALSAWAFSLVRKTA